MSKDYVVVNIKPEDEAYAQRQDQWNCAIVRSIQRSVPDALRVTANSKKIAFTLERDDCRYEFITPPEVVEGIIKPFDLHKPLVIHEFVLSEPISKTPVKHITKEQRQAQRTAKAGKNKSSSSVSAAVRTYNRFLDDES